MIDIISNPVGWHFCRSFWIELTYFSDASTFALTLYFNRTFTNYAYRQTTQQLYFKHCSLQSTCLYMSEIKRSKGSLLYLTFSYQIKAWAGNCGNYWTLDDKNDNEETLFIRFDNIKY